MEDRAKLFWNGRSQAVRLPKKFRFEGTEVLVRRAGDAVILEPVPRREWPVGYWQRIDDLGEGLDLPEIEPIRGTLTEVPLDSE